MAQIKPNQIIQDNSGSQQVSLPRDLITSLLNSDVTDATQNTVQLATGSYQSPSESHINSINQPPLTPVILAVKSQEVVFNEDGTASIDLVIVVQDVNNATEYEVRIARDAGTL